jgi:hypothetical protein
VAREALRRAARGGVETKMRRDSIARKKRERWGRGSCCVGGREKREERREKREERREKREERREKREERFLAAWADIIAGAMTKKKRRPTSLEMTVAGGRGWDQRGFLLRDGVHDTD